MNFKKALWDGSDPYYAPFLGWSRDTPYWKISKKYRDLGYSITSVRLEGRRGDGKDLERAQKARELTREMLAWFEGNSPSLTVGSVKWLIARYLNDDISPIQALKASSKPDYQKAMRRWEKAAGEVPLKKINYEVLMRWLNAMQNNDRSVAYISRMFRHFRALIGYGIRLEEPDCGRIKAILGEMRIPQSSPKSVVPTPEQVLSVISAAEDAGESAFALGLQLQWWFHLRAVDVRGQYLKLGKDDERSGIIRGNSRWVDGLVWAMFDKDLTFFEKTQSKTMRHGVQSYRYDLTIVPEVRNKLLSTPKEHRVGPVIIKQTTGLPYHQDEWSRIWRKFADIAGLPKEIKVMDIRAGAATDGSKKGATRTQLKNALGHMNENTTERYIRTGDGDMNDVVKLRREQ